MLNLSINLHYLEAYHWKIRSVDLKLTILHSDTCFLWEDCDKNCFFLCYIVSSNKLPVSKVSKSMKRKHRDNKKCVQQVLFETNFSWHRRVAFLIYIFQDMISPLLYENKLYFVPQQGLSRRDVSGVPRPSPLSDIQASSHSHKYSIFDFQAHHFLATFGKC